MESKPLWIHYRVNNSLWTGVNTPTHRKCQLKHEKHPEENNEIYFKANGPQIVFKLLSLINYGKYYNRRSTNF